MAPQSAVVKEMRCSTALASTIEVRSRYLMDVVCELLWLRKEKLSTGSFGGAAGYLDLSVLQPR